MTRRIQYLVPIDVFEKFAAKYIDGTRDHSKREKRQAVPASIDYRTNGWVTPIKDQGTLLIMQTVNP